MDPSGIAAIRDLDWTSRESRQRVSVVLGVAPASESLISALSHVMTTELNAARSAAVSAILRLDAYPFQRTTGWREPSNEGYLVFRAMLDGLNSNRAPVRAAAASAISTAKWERDVLVVETPPASTTEFGSA
jgi:hypothetical protein